MIAISARPRGRLLFGHPAFAPRLAEDGAEREPAGRRDALENQAMPRFVALLVALVVVTDRAGGRVEDVHGERNHRANAEAAPHPAELVPRRRPPDRRGGRARE